MDGEKIINPGANYPNGNRNEDQASEDIADRRSEYAETYARVRPEATVATAEQIKYIQLLLKDGWLGKDDFGSSREFFRKKTMSRQGKPVEEGREEGRTEIF